MLGKMDARVDAIHAFTRADISVDGITECIVVVAVDVVRLPDLFQLIRRRDRLANSRLYVQWPQMKNTISGSVRKPFSRSHWPVYHFTLQDIALSFPSDTCNWVGPALPNWTYYAAISAFITNNLYHCWCYQPTAHYNKPVHVPYLCTVFFSPL